VKGKSGSGFGDPLEMVHAEKLRRLHLAAESWLAGQPQLRALDLRFEVVAVRAGTLERVAV
jgi:Holliday junction resolvase-like predicted endonuclease